MRYLTMFAALILLAAPAVATPAPEAPEIVAQTELTTPVVSEPGGEDVELPGTVLDDVKTFVCNTQSCPEACNDEKNACDAGCGNNWSCRRQCGCDYWHCTNQCGCDQDPNQDPSPPPGPDPPNEPGPFPPPGC